MLIDGRSLEPGTRLSADVAIVGAGPAGISVARTLMGTGIRSIVLESGGERPDAESNALNAGRSVGYPYHPLDRPRVRAFAGTSHLWDVDVEHGEEGWNARPLDPIDFLARDGVPGSGWPFGVTTLEAYYRRAQRLADLGPYAYDTGTWRWPDAAPLDDVADVRTVMFQVGESTFLRELDTFRRAADCTLVLHATVSRVRVTESGGSVAGVDVLVRPGVTVAVDARVVVLAAGGIENPRILLLSRDRRPVGLGNSRDLVGRYFMERITARAGHIVPAPALLGRSLALYGPRRVDGVVVRGALALPSELVLREKLQNAVFFLVRRPGPFASEAVRSATTIRRAYQRTPRLGGLRGHAGNVVRGLPSVAATAAWLAAGGRREAGGALLLAAQAEQAPDRDSRVLLDRATDPYGMPQAMLDWRPRDTDLASVRKSEQILSARLQARGLGWIARPLGDERPHALITGSYHHMGTTRMATDPAHGVVDANGEVHDVAGLFVTGSSVFPTSGAANPTLTIVALAIRLGDHLIDRHRRPRIPIVISVTGGRSSAPAVVAAGGRQPERAGRG